jgi:hypothetical protein
MEENQNSITAELYLPFVVSKIIKSGSAKVRVLPSNEKWFGVTYKEDKDIVIRNIEEMIRSGIYPSALWG